MKHQECFHHNKKQAAKCAAGFFKYFGWIWWDTKKPTEKDILKLYTNMETGLQNTNKYEEFACTSTGRLAVYRDGLYSHDGRKQ